MSGSRRPDICSFPWSTCWSRMVRRINLLGLRAGPSRRGQGSGPLPHLSGSLGAWWALGYLWRLSDPRWWSDLCDHAHHRMTIKLQQWLENSVLHGCSDFFRASRLIREAFLTECHALMAQQEHTTHHSQGWYWEVHGHGLACMLAHGALPLRYKWISGNIILQISTQNLEWGRLP